jgi:tetratricopeptide (TPR) repeat protein
MNNYLLRPLAACIFAGFAAAAHAQFIDDVDLRQEGANAVMTIKFVTPVRYSKSISARASDLVQSFYTVLPTRDQINDVISERRLAAAGDIPSITVTDEADSTAASQMSGSRKLVIRFGAPLQFRVRVGHDSRSIEIVLEGLGASVKTGSGEVRPATVSPVAGAVPAAPAVQASAEIEASATALLSAAQSAFDTGNYNAATDSLNKLLDLPPNGSSRRAQEMAGLARLNAGDSARAAKEFDLFLKLYPVGPDSDRVRQLMPSLPSAQAAAQIPKKAVEATSSTNGSVSMFYYGGKSNTRTQEYQDSVVGGLPILQSDTSVPYTDQRQWQTNVDLNWRYRDAEKDMRFVFRDNYSLDQKKSSGKQKLSALYFDYRSMVNGTSMRVGRQSPSGGGVLYRFDGIQAGYAFQPKWKLNAVVGQPTDAFLDSRKFYGVSVDAEALTKELSGSAFVIEQVIDGVTDRRGVGADLRYLSGGLSAAAQFDYDAIMKAVNVAAIQTTWQISEASVVNASFDRRASPTVQLNNVLTYSSTLLSAVVSAEQRIQNLLGSYPIETLRQAVKDTTPYVNQAQIAGSTAIAKNWQVGGNLSLVNMDTIPPVDAVGFPGQPSTTGRAVGAQLIGNNLYSARDAHVFNLSLSNDTATGSPTMRSNLLSYNNVSSLDERWQLEPSVKYLVVTAPTGYRVDSKSVGTRVTYRILQQLAFETELTYTRSNTHTAAVGSALANDISSNNTTYNLGLRYEF